jgi:methylmalonyl-CoA/ethylmalonyl-CoA epimerase
MDPFRPPSSTLAFHHLGFVVPNIAAAIEGFNHSLEAAWEGRVYEDPHQRVKVAFVAVRPGDPLIELIEPAAEDSPVRHFLAERGGGLHHVCYEVDEIEEQLTLLRSRGCMIVRRPKPAIAFNGRMIAWVFTAQKLLVELLQKDKQQLT